jgi:hypothetical protein
MTPNTVGWLLGRGVTAACGFAWEVPPAAYHELRSGPATRDAMVTWIKTDLRRRQDQALKEGQIDTSSLEDLAKAITADRNRRWTHAFITTNWNTVIDLVLQPHGQRVWHLNGSIDGPADAFLTQADTPEQRNGSLEKHPGFRWLLEAEVCVVAGMSLRWAFDREVLHLLGTRQRGRNGRSWCVVNQSEDDLSRTHALLSQYASHESIRLVRSSFQDWVRAGLLELKTIGHNGCKLPV